jgi:hypothetical protein
MASRFPLILDETNNQLRELPVGDDLDLTGNNLTGLSSLSTTGGITAGGTLTSPLILATNATVSGTVEALTYTVGGLPLLEQVSFNNLLDAPVIPVDVNQLADTDGLLGGGFSGDYNDLINTPTIPTDINQLGDNDNLIPTDLADLTDNSSLLAGGTFESLGDAFTFDGRADQLVVVNATEENLTTITTASILDALTDTQVTGALGFTPYNATNPDGFINSAIGITDALGYTPYNSTNPDGFITGIAEVDITNALGYTPYNGTTNPNAYINATEVVTAIGYTPYNGATNSLGFLTSETQTLDDVLTLGSVTTQSIGTGALTSTGQIVATDMQLNTGGLSFNHSNAFSIDTAGGNSMTIGGNGNLVLDSGNTISINASLTPAANIGLGDASNEFASAYISGNVSLGGIIADTANLQIDNNNASGTITFEAGAGIRVRANYVELAQSGGGTDAQRPSSPSEGTYMYNTTHGYHQLYLSGRDFVNAAGNGIVTGGWATFIPPVGGTPNADDTFIGMMAIADGLNWDPVGDGSQALMVFLNNSWLEVVTN